MTKTTSDLKYTCIVHPCGLKRVKGSGFCSKHKKAHKGKVHSHPKGHCRSLPREHNASGLVPQDSKTEPAEDRWEDVGYQLD